MDTTRLRCALLLPLLLAACTPAAEPDPDAAATDAADTARQDAPAPPVADAAGAAGGLVVEDAWIRSGPPGAPALAGYAVLRNGSAVAMVVRPCATDGFAAVELHRTTHEDGMARMRPLAELAIDPGGEVVLAPGGTHLMLMQPARVAAPGERTSICLSIDGQEKPVEFEVRDAGGAVHSHH